MITRRKVWWLIEYYDQEIRRRPVRSFVRKAASEEQAIRQTSPQPENWLCEANPLPLPESPEEISNPGLFSLTAICVAYFCYQMLTWAKPSALEWTTAGLLVFSVVYIGAAMMFESRIAHPRHNPHRQATNHQKTSS